MCTAPKNAHLHAALWPQAAAPSQGQRRLSGAIGVSAPLPHWAALQVWTQAPQGLGLLVLYWSLLYLATAIQEDKCHVD